MLAICEIAGNQYLISQGDRIKTEKIQAEKGDILHIEKVLLVSENDKTEIGQPYISGCAVNLEVLEHGRGVKIRVFKMKAKKRYQRTIGHRQGYSELLVKEILKAEETAKVKPVKIEKVEMAEPEQLKLTTEMPTAEPAPKAPRKRAVKKAVDTTHEAKRSASSIR